MITKFIIINNFKVKFFTTKKFFVSYIRIQLRFDEQLLKFSFWIMTSVISNSMAWTNERLKVSSAENVGLKTIWKMLVFDNTTRKEVISYIFICIK